MPAAHRLAHLDALRDHIAATGDRRPALASSAARALRELLGTIRSPARDEAVATHAAHLRRWFAGERRFLDLIGCTFVPDEPHTVAPRALARRPHDRRHALYLRAPCLFGRKYPRG